MNPHERKLNLGAGDNWSKEGWEVLDHSSKTLFGFRPQAWSLPFPDKTFDVVFTSHMIEHISHYKIEQVICEINRVLKYNGVLRILTPDLQKLATAYVNKDWETMNLYLKEDGSNFEPVLGIGQAFMSFLSSPGHDNYLISSDWSEPIAGYAHMFSYDYEMLSGLLERYGFHSIIYSDIDESEIEDHKDLRICSYDHDKNHSLVVECKKETNAVYDVNNLIFHQQSVYNVSKIVPTALNPFSILLKMIGFLRNLSIYFLSNLPKGLKGSIRNLFGS